MVDDDGACPRCRAISLIASVVALANPILSPQLRITYRSPSRPGVTNGAAGKSAEAATGLTLLDYSCFLFKILLLTKKRKKIIICCCWLFRRPRNSLWRFATDLAIVDLEGTHCIRVLSCDPCLHWILSTNFSFFPATTWVGKHARPTNWRTFIHVGFLPLILRILYINRDERRAIYPNSLMLLISSLSPREYTWPLFPLHHVPFSFFIKIETVTMVAIHY